MTSGGSAMQEVCGAADAKPRRGIYTYEAPWTIYGMNWSVRGDSKFRLAVGSFIEEFRNKVEIVQLDNDSGKFYTDPKLAFDHPYPATKIMFIPDKESEKPDLMATAGDSLRVWQIHEVEVELKSVLNPQNREYCLPLTAFDWNESELWRLVTSSIDKTCTVWDIEAGVVDTLLIAHDKEVHDIAWGGVGIFASVSADGSVRLFDLRDTRHSMIAYEGAQPLLRLGWNKQDPWYMATILMDSPKVVILDLRLLNTPVSELQRHQACVNAIAWAPNNASCICSAGDDSQALIWDISAKPVDGELDPILAYTAGGEVNQLQWSVSHSDWVAIAFAKKLQVLRV